MSDANNVLSTAHHVTTLIPALAAKKLSLWELWPLENAIAWTEPAINKHFKLVNVKFGRHVRMVSTIPATIFASPAQPTVPSALTFQEFAPNVSQVTALLLLMQSHSFSISKLTHAPAVTNLTTTLSNFVSHVPEIVWDANMEPENALTVRLDSKSNKMVPAIAQQINTRPKEFVVMLLFVRLEPTISVTTFASNVPETALLALIWLDPAHLVLLVLFTNSNFWH